MRYLPTPERQKQIKATLANVRRWIESNKQAGATVAKVEKRLAVARGTLTRWLNGKRWPTKSQVKKLESLTLTGTIESEKPYPLWLRLQMWRASQDFERRRKANRISPELTRAERQDRQYNGDEE